MFLNGIHGWEFRAGAGTGLSQDAFDFHSAFCREATKRGLFIQSVRYGQVPVEYEIFFACDPEKT
jgi:hypothetical protein